MLSRMMPKPVETGAEARQQAIKPEQAGGKTDQPAMTSTKGDCPEEGASTAAQPVEANQAEAVLV